jgi:proteasome lid subunit RPN8/RPN11
MDLTASLTTAIQAHALATYPEEACGVIKDGQYVRCRNVAAAPRLSFRIAARRLASLMPVEAIVHSHPDGPDSPTADDMRQQIATAVPWIIVSTDGRNCTEPFIFGDGGPVPPLVGRGFRHGVTDCYALIRDAFRIERTILLPEFPREWEWWLQDGDLYRDGFAEAGFRRLKENESPQPWDVFLAQTPRSSVPNHGGIYVGDGLILHHLTARHPVDPTRLSAREPGSRWQAHVTHWLRYQG